MLSKHAEHGREVADVDEASFELLSLTSKEYKRYCLLSPSEWLTELLTSLLSVLLLVAICAIFISMDNKPLSAWTARISLNAMVAILTTACAAALMHGISASISQLKWLYFKQVPRKLYDLERFDHASRGPWGSILFLTNVKWNLATIGAIVTIARLAFGPLAQQVLNIEQRLVTTNDPAVSFGYTHAYNRGLGKFIGAAGFTGLPQDAGMQSAIIQGFYDIKTPIGFKSECRNVTQQTLHSTSCKNSGSDSQPCNMTTPGGIDVEVIWVDTDATTTFYMNSLTANLNTGLHSSVNIPELARFAIYRASYDTGDGLNLDYRPFNINITECSLSLTAYNYTNAYANGSTFSFEQAQEVDFGTGNPWQSYNDGIGNGYGALIYTTNASVENNMPALSVSGEDLTAMLQFFKSDVIACEWVDGNYDNQHMGISAALRGDVDLNVRFQKMATSMTDYLRTRPDSQLAYGGVVAREAFVVIRWLYMIGPIAIELASLVFCISTIMTNRRSRNIPLWKSSTLAILNCQSGIQSTTMQPTSRDIKEMEEAAKSSLVRLE